MKDLISNIYNGIFRFKPVRNVFKRKSSHGGNYPRVGFLTDELARKLQDNLGITITRREVFEQALIHRSYLQVLSDPDYLSNERLEFLGDAVLGMVVAEYLYSLHADVLEGELTKMRSWLVNKRSLALCAKKLELEQYIMLSYSAEKSLKNGSESILADALEAVIAAIYIDSGLNTARSFIINSLLPMMMNKHIMEDKNFKSQLLEEVQAIGKEAPKYEVLDEFGPDHDKEFLIGVYVDNKLVGTGKGKSKKAAEQEAAQNALEQQIFLNTKLNDE